MPDMVNRSSMNDVYLRESKHEVGKKVTTHQHDFYQILYVLENEGTLALEKEDHQFTQDNLAFIAPQTKHAIFANQKTTILVLEFDIDKLDVGIKRDLIEARLPGSKVFELNMFEAGEVRQLLRKMLYEQSLANEINHLALKIYLSELLLILIQELEDPVLLDANILRAVRLRKYIDTHYYQMIDASYISSMLGISIRHINNIFKEQYGLTPIQYLNEVRMELARKMLIETDKDIASICFEVGFESLSTFYRAFKNYNQVAPNQVRERYKEINQAK